MAVAKKVKGGAGGRKAAPKVKRQAADNVASMSPFTWTEKTSAAAIGLAEGKTQQEVADEIGVNKRTVQRWAGDIEFSTEVDRLSLMVGIASRAERLRLAQRVVRQKTSGGSVDTDKDLLDWVKFAQSETDGAKLDLAAFAAAFGKVETPVAEGRHGGRGAAEEGPSGKQ